MITGAAAVTPLGESVAETFDGLLAGRSATRDDAGGNGAPLSFDGLPIRRREANRLTRADALAVVSAGRAAVDAGLADDPATAAGAALYLGTSKDVGSYEDFIELLPELPSDPFASVSLAAIVERASGMMSPFFLLDCMPNLAMHYVATMFGIRGDNCCFTALGCAGADAVQRVLREVAGGGTEVGVAGGFDRLSDPFNQDRLLAQWFLTDERPSVEDDYRPFHRSPGLPVFADGAGALVLEEREHARARCAPICGRLLGAAGTFNAGPPYGPGGATAIRAAVGAALSDAGLAAGELAFVVASGQGAWQVDLAEAEALREVLGGAPVPITAWKGATGHLMSAAAPVELAVALECLERRTVAPLAGPDPFGGDGALRFVLGEPAPIEGAFALVLSLGLRGQAHAFVVGSRDS